MFRRLPPWLPILACLLGAAATADAQVFEYGWTISSSSTDPFENEAPFLPGVQTYYLFYACCSNDEGMTAAAFTLSSSPANPVLGFSPLNGFLNAGNATDLVLAVAGCPCGPILAGSINVLVSVPGNLCLAPSPDGVATVDCDPSPQIHESAWIGLDIGGAGSCGEGEPSQLCGHVDAWSACCLPGNVCVDVGSFQECEDLGGIYQGWPSGCYEYPCCLPDGTCVMTPSYCGECEALGGVLHYGAGTCEAANCQPVSVESDSWGRTKVRYRD